MKDASCIRLDSGNALWYKNKLVNGNDSNANTSVISHAGKMYAIVEAGGYPWKLIRISTHQIPNPFTDIGMRVSRLYPKIDPDTNEMHACATTMQIILTLLTM